MGRVAAGRSRNTLRTLHEKQEVTGGVATFRTWKSLASLHRLQKRGSSRCSTVSLPNIVTTLHMICGGTHRDGSVRKNITWLSGARPQDVSVSHHLNTMWMLYDSQFP